MWSNHCEPRWAIRVVNNGPESVFVHPNGLVESKSVGSGTRVWAFAHIMDGAIVGTDCNIGDHSFIESGAVIGNRVTIKNSSLIWHGVTIEDDVFIGPNVIFTNDLRPRSANESGPDDWLETHVKRGATIGANCTILPGIAIGEDAMVAAGSVVTKDVLNRSLVVGNPAAHSGWVCLCGSSLNTDLACESCGRKYATSSNGLVAAQDEN